MRPANAFAGYPLDKAGVKRKDAAFLAAAMQDARARVALFQDAAPLILAESGASPVAAPVWLGPLAFSLVGAKGLAVFLGLEPTGVPVFALDLPKSFDLEASAIAGLGAFEDLRAVAMRASPEDSALLGCAKALFEWHARSGFCARCGGESAPADGGWRRQCARCGDEAFPRIDPVAIMLPVRGERCCLGRQSRFPRGMYSAFAGFVEPGESLEEACARELMEETGLKALSITHHSSQPWPFPSSLMIGMIAEVESETLRLDPEEIEAAKWVNREQALRLLDGGCEIEGERLWAPPPIAIAHRLLRSWAEGG